MAKLGSPLNQNIITGSALSNRPNEHDILGETFQEGSKRFGERPRGKSGIAAAFMGGIGAGLKSKGQEKREKVLSYLEEVNNSAMERNNWYENKQMQDTQISGAADAYNKVLLSKPSYEEAKQYTDFLFTDLTKNGVIPEGSINLGPIPNNLSVYTFKTPDGQVQAIDTQTKMSPEGMSLYKQGLENNIQNRKLDMNQQSLDIQRENAPAMYRGQGERNNIQRQNADLRRETYESKQAEKYTDQLTSYNQLDKIIGSAKEIVKRNPEVFRSVSSIIWGNSDKDPGFIDKMVQKGQEKFGFGSKDADDYTKLLKDINQMKLLRLKGITKPNMTVDSWLGQGTPNESMTANAFLKAVNEMENDVKIKEKIASRQFEKVAPEYYNIVKEEIERPNISNKKEGFIRLRSPDGNEIMEIALNDPNLDALIQAGAVEE
jgi:hypothetical protein